MKTGISILNTEYIVNNNVTVCRLTVKLKLIESPAYPYLNDEAWRKKFPNIHPSGVFTVTSKARCSKADKYDSVFGERLAKSRAEAKAFKVAYRFWGFNYRYLDNKCFTELRNKTAICIRAYERERKHISGLLK